MMTLNENKILHSCSRLKDPKLRKLALMPSPTSPLSPSFPQLSNHHAVGRAKSHQRSLSDAPAMKQGLSESNLNGFQQYNKRVRSLGLPRNCLGDLTSGHGFDNGCICFDQGQNDFKPDRIECSCGVKFLLL